MGLSVNFSPSNINCGVVAPGGTTIQSTQCAPLSAPVNVTASISNDTSGGAITLLPMASFIIGYVTETLEPGQLPGGGPTNPVTDRVQVAEKIAQSNGATPFAVASGQYVQVNIQFAPTASTPDSSTATLHIQGDTWNPVSIPIVATVGELSVTVPTITVRQGASTTVDLKVTSVAGDGTTANLIMGADTSTEAPNVTVTLDPSSLTIDKGKSASTRLTVSAPWALATGPYPWECGVSAFDNTVSFSVPVVINVEEPYYFIKSKLGNVIDIVDSSTKSGAGLDAFTQKGTEDQLWNFIPSGSGYYHIVSKLNGNAIDIEGASTKAGALLDAFPPKSGADNQLWYFVSDPGGSGSCYIVSKLNGNVIDVQGASSKAGTLLDAFPASITGAENQQWTVVDGNFPSVVPTVPFAPFWGNGNVNYIFDGNGDALTGVSVTVKFTDDFSSSANGYGFQLNCYSTEGSSITTVWQQYVVYANPGDNTLYAVINNWSGSFPNFAQVINTLDNPAPLATLPSPTIPKGYAITIALSYYQDTAIVNGAVFTVKDNTGKTIGTTTVAILGQTLVSTGQPATVANLAPIAILQLCIVGDYNNATATLTEGAGTITYYASSGFNVTPLGPTLPPESVFHSFTGTGENSNIFYGPLPWPFSISMTSQNNTFEQLFELTPGGLPKVDALRLQDLLKRHSLPAPKK